MKLAPALVPLEAWFWYMLFLDLLSAKLCLGFLIELIEQILHTIKFGEILLFINLLLMIQLYIP